MTDNTPIYATLPRRMKAGLIDLIIMLSLFILIPLVISSISESDTPTKVILMFAPPLLLEPFLITYFGFTLGQYFFGIQVVKTNNQKCPLLISFIRYYTKLILGGLSMMYMLFSKKHQAIHDHLAGTIVLISQNRIEKNPEFANQGEPEQVKQEDYIYPSPLRRFGVFIIWYIIASICFGMAIEAIALLTIPEYTIETESLPEQFDIVINIINSVLFFSSALLASKGYLPLAKRKKKLSDVTRNNTSE